MLPYDTPPPGGGLYFIRLSDRHFYGGRARSFKARWEHHYKALVKGKHSNRYMQNVFNKHGRFEPQILEKHKTKEARIASEQAWLDEHHGTEGFVNLSPNATGGNVVDWTPEQRAKHSQALMGHVRSEESKRKQSETIRSRPDLIEKARASLARNSCTDPEVLRGNIQKAIEANIGRKQSPEHVEKRAAKHRGRKNTPETLALMSESAKHRAAANPTVHSQATRALISSQQKGRIWINNGVKNRRLFPEEASELLTQGWVRGKLGRCGSGLWAHRYVDGELERKRVPKVELPGLLAIGWSRGTGPQG